MHVVEYSDSFCDQVKGKGRVVGSEKERSVMVYC